MKRLPLIWRVFLSTSLFTTLLFGLIGYIVQAHTTRVTAVMLEEELRSSFRAYEALWKSRADFLSSTSRLMSSLPDVRAAFSTEDTATIRDSASELWSRVSRADGVFFVTDPEGRVIASLSKTIPASLKRIDSVVAVAPKFPAQSNGFTFLGDKLHQVVISPVYVDTSRGPALINVLVAGIEVNEALVRMLKESTDGSDSIITARGRVIASTVAPSTASSLVQANVQRDQLEQAKAGEETWSVLATALNDPAGQPIGELRILRPFTSASRRIADLSLQIVVIWALAILFTLVITFRAATRLLAPVKLLDNAAREVGKGNYDYRVPLDGDDEMGRLGRTFNAMSASIRQSREDLIRQERINTLGRIASSVVHDLRNPLAAIYSGAEILIDTEGLPPTHTKRLASNIYRASRQVLTQLDDLLAITRGKGRSAESTKLSELVEDAWAGLAAQAEKAGVSFAVEGDTSLEAPISRARIERVFGNLFVNAIEAMPKGGHVSVHISLENGTAVVRVRDTGPGVPAQLRENLFQPFATSGKSNGLGLGLALSRQTVLEHGGDLSLEPCERGACFRVTLPIRVAANVA